MPRIFYLCGTITVEVIMNRLFFVFCLMVIVTRCDGQVAGGLIMQQPYQKDYFKSLGGGLRIEGYIPLWKFLDVGGAITYSRFISSTEMIERFKYVQSHVFLRIKSPSILKWNVDCKYGNAISIFDSREVDLGGSEYTPEQSRFQFREVLIEVGYKISGKVVLCFGSVVPFMVNPRVKGLTSNSIYIGATFRPWNLQAVWGREHTP